MFKYVYRLFVSRNLERKAALESELDEVRKVLRRNASKQKALDRFRASRCRMEFHGELKDTYDAILGKLLREQADFKRRETALVGMIDHRKVWIKKAQLNAQPVRASSSPVHTLKPSPVG